MYDTSTSLMIRRGLRTAALPLTTLLWSSISSSQLTESSVPLQPKHTGQGDTPATSTPAEAQRTYSPTEFLVFAPQTALDMLMHVPGFGIEQPDGRRGFAGGASNILINGQRFSGKSNDAVTELARIPASNVLRLEIADGATLGIQGLSGSVANVITKPRRISGHFAWRPEFQPRGSDAALTAGNASLSSALGQLQYTMAVRNESVRRSTPGLKLVRTQTGGIIDHREELHITREDRINLSGTFKYEIDTESVANLNVSYGQLLSSTKELSDRSGPNLVDRFRTSSDVENGRDWEIGGDVEFVLGGARLKIIGLSRFERSPKESGILTEFADERTPLGSRFVRAGNEVETIARTEFRWKNSLVEWHIYAEGALNRLQNIAGLYELLADGSFSEVRFPGASGRVQEERAELTVGLGRARSRRFSVRGSVAGEFSRLSQSNAVERPREFARPKGLASISWKASPRLDLKATVQRAVGQLNFLDFLSSKHLRSGNVSTANPRLVPPVSWEAEIEAIRHIGAYDVLKLRLYGREIRDVIDVVSLGPGLEGLGNIDHASVRGAELTTTIKMDPLGWKGAKIDVNLQLQRSRLKDPLTREMRRLSRDLIRKIDLSLRHDLPRSDWAWGADFIQVRRARGFRLASIDRTWEAPGAAGVFVENKNVMGLKVRLSLRNLLGPDEHTRRTFFRGWRPSDIVRVESSVRSKGPSLALSVSGHY